jgi:hypothetical protein
MAAGAVGGGEEEVEQNEEGRVISSSVVGVSR